MELTPKQRFLVWYLLISGDEPMVSKIKPDMSLKDCKPLQEAELIDIEQRKTPKGRKANFVITTDKTWDWAVENFSGELSKTQFAAPLLEKLLSLAGQHLSRHHLSLAELLRPEPSQAQQESGNFANLPARLLETCLDLSGGQPGKRVYLSGLREKLADVPRAIVDEHLIALHKERRIVLMGLDDPQSIRAEDEAAALILSGIPKYILYLQS